MSQSEKIRLADYRPPEFTTDKVGLNIDLEEDHAYVTSFVIYTRTDEGQNAKELVLNAENPNPDGVDFIKSISVNGEDLAEGTGYTYDREKHEIRIPVSETDDEVNVEVRTYLEPQHNSKLTGLYESDGSFVTQCESEGFRRITAFTDRPDVMAKYRVRIRAPEDKYPVMLANGNMIAGGDAKNGYHWAMYEDPWPKPSYLFCTANGDLECVEDKFITMSGREVLLRVWIEAGAGDPEKGRHALEALKMSMKWDEDVFGCEYDLDVYDVVAVAKFTFGAMENKGLNIFRDSLIMANPDIATDANYQSIIDVIGHEYFHNYSGNRVTLANWLNISLKEGLTVMREQMFTAFTTSNAVERISAVQDLRSRQFAEDDSPFAHAVQPQEVESVENCYSGTIYQKGSEVIRMMKIMMGEDTFIDAVKHYFNKHDGQAVTIKEFVECMEEVSGLDFSGQFQNWYKQSGRPRVKAEGTYDAAAKTYTLTLEQQTPATADQPVKQPQVIPVVMGLVDANGNDMPLTLAGDDANTADSGATERVIKFTDAKQTFVFENVDSEPAFHSLFRDFSAPVTFDPGLSEDQLYQQLLNDTDGFNRWDAGQKLALSEMQRLYEGYKTTGQMPDVSTKYLDSFKRVVNDTETEPALVAAALSMPSVDEFEGVVQPADPAAIAAVRKHLRETIGKTLYNDFAEVYSRTHTTRPYKFNYESVGNRSLKALAFNYLMANGGADNIEGAKNFYFAANNMTDRMMAMSNIRDYFGPEREAVFQDFYDRFKNDSLVIQKWFMSQAISASDDAIKNLEAITESEEFNWQNPGHVASVYRGFAANYSQFHRADGEGYRFLADGVIKEDTINPRIAAGIVEDLCAWRKYEGENPKLMIKELERIASTEGLSVDTKEKVVKSLPNEEERKALEINSDATSSAPTGPAPNAS